MKLKMLSVLLALVVVALSATGAIACSDNYNSGPGACNNCGGYGGYGFWNCCNWDLNWNCFWNWIWSLICSGLGCNWY